MFLAECEGYITDLSIAVKEGSLEVDKLPDPMTKSSVLSPFNLSLFNDIQVPISCRQASILIVVSDETESSEK